MSDKYKRRSEYGKGWDGRSRVPDKTYKENFDQINEGRLSPEPTLIHD